MFATYSCSKIDGIDSDTSFINSASSTNLSKIFDIVHDANLKKKDPNTGKYLRRDDGKIMKPPMWKEPDIVGEINNQSIYGAF